MLVILPGLFGKGLISWMKLKLGQIEFISRSQEQILEKFLVFAVEATF